MAILRLGLGQLQALLLAAWLVAGCRSSPMERHLQELKGLQVELIAVYPCGLRWPEPRTRGLDLSQHLITTGLVAHHDDVMFLGPEEFRVLHDSDENGWASTDVVALLPSLQVSPSRAVILRPWVEKLVASSQKEILSARGKSEGAASAEETTYRGHLELIHPSTGTKLAELIAETKVDPFLLGSEEDADPAPGVTRVLDALMAEAMVVLAPSFHRHPGPLPPGPTYAFNPNLGAEAVPAAEAPDSAPTPDPLALEILRLNRIRFDNPELTDAQVGKLARLPGGLWIRSAKPGAALAWGDLVTQVEGKPAFPQTLERARLSPSPVTLRVLRANKSWTELSFP